MTTPSKHHVAVLGGGIIGLCSAYYLRQAGFDVTVVDRNGPQSNGCSHGNAGMLVPSHFVPLAAPGMISKGLAWMLDSKSPFYIHPRFNLGLARWGYHFWKAASKASVAKAGPTLANLNLWSRELYSELSESGIAMDLSPTGLLMLCKTQATLDEESELVDAANEFGMGVSVLSASETSAKQAGLDVSVCGSVFYPMDAHLNPNRLVAALEEHLVAQGVQFIRNAHLASFELELGRIRAVRSSNGVIEADSFVLCGGTWSSELASSIDLRLPMEAGKGYSLTLNEPPQSMSICSILAEAKVAVTPMQNAIRFGGTMELAGLNSTIDNRRVDGIVQSIPKYFPAFDAERFAAIEPWSGLRPLSPDGLPYIGPSNAASNLVVATGHAMMGLSLGPVTGRIVADILDRGRMSLKERGIDGNLISPDRFSRQPQANASVSP